MSLSGEVLSDIPATFTMTLEERARHIYLAETDLEYRAMFLRMVDDPDMGDVFFINTCCWTFDPRNGPNGKPIGPIPFILWEAQARAARKIGQAMDGGHDLGEEKSRDQGLTWINLCLIWKRALRQRGFSALIGAMTEDLLDSTKSPATLGWKLDFLYDHLPAFLRAREYNPENPAHRSWASWSIPDTGSYINGRSPTPRFAVGDRKSVAYFDDWAQWEHGGPAWEAAAATTNCRLASWTVNPENPLNHAYDLRFGKGRFEGVKTAIIRVEELHWTSDPRKQDTALDPDTGETYNTWKRLTVGDPARRIPGKISHTQFLRDYEGVYEIASKGRIYGEQLPFARIGDFPFDPRFPLYSFWDYGVSDVCGIIWAQWDWEEYRLRLIDCVARSGHGIEYYVPFLTGRKDPAEVLPKEEEYDESDRRIITRHTAWQQFSRVANARVVTYLDHFGDPAGTQRSISHNKSARDVLADNEIFVRARNDNAGKGYKGRIESTRRLLPFMDIDKSLCGPLLDALQNYKWNKTGTEPEHDENSHLSASLEYGCVNLEAEIIEMIRARAQSKGRVGRVGGVFGDPRAVFQSEEDDRKEVYNTSNGSRGVTGY